MMPPGSQLGQQTVNSSGVQSTQQYSMNNSLSGNRNSVPTNSVPSSMNTSGILKGTKQNN